MSICKAAKSQSHGRGLFRYLRCLRHDVFYALLHRETGPLEYLGNRSTGFDWTIRTRGLGPKSIVYSAGVGRDISFEHAIADRFGSHVILMDPSPTGLETMGLAENHRPEFTFIPVALAGTKGELHLTPPPNVDEGSWIPESVDVRDMSELQNSITVPCESIITLMERFGHTHIDLLKMDIEGSEYEVLDAMLAKGIIVEQIAVEFHNSVLAGISRGQTIRMLLRLFFRGYCIIHKGGSNHTLMHQRFIQ